jgi:rhamnosyl/mannosyltransferase
LAQAVNVLLEDEEQARRMGLAARARYERLFSGPALGKAYVSLYEEVLKATVKMGDGG